MLDFFAMVGNYEQRNDGEWVIVELYDTKDQAKAGHLRCLISLLSLIFTNKLR